MLWAELHPPKIHVEALTHNTSSFGNRVIASVISEDEGTVELGRALVQYDWCPRKGTLGRDTDTEGEGNVKRHREETASDKPRREAWNGSCPHSPPTITQAC